MAATAGRAGTVVRGEGGVLVAGPLPVANGYVNAAFPNGSAEAASGFLDRAIGFFAGVGSPFVLWDSTDDVEMVDGAIARGGAADEYRLFDIGVGKVHLQATEAGFPVSAQHRAACSSSLSQ